MTPLLEQAFSPEAFRQYGRELVDLLADHLDAVHNDSEAPVIAYVSPEEQLNWWEQDFQRPVAESPVGVWRDILNRSIHVARKRYIGHQVPPPAPVAALSQLLTAVLNNGMGVYEMGMAGNAIERIVARLVARRMGFDENASGFFTSGGALANLTALLTARAALTQVWELGPGEKLGVMVSEEAHYCVDRAARIMGFGDEGIIKIPVNDRFQMRTELLDDHFDLAESRGLRIICVIGSACSTSTGAFDDLQAVGAFCRRRSLWFHVDGAHGGAAVFSQKYRPLLRGIEAADSVVLDFHKMLLSPSPASVLIFRRDEDAYKTFAQKAQYLWADQNAREWYNSGKRTFECTKPMMVVGVYTLLRTYGEALYEQNVDTLFDLGSAFAALVRSRPLEFELALEPQCNIVCFRCVGAGDLNDLNNRIRERLLADGKFYIVQTFIRNAVYLRASIMNPLTTPTELNELLQEIARISQELERAT